jgi:glucans biosynthesis protein
LRSRSALFLLCGALLLRLLGSTASAQAGGGEQQPFSPALVKRLAANLAKQPFLPPPAPTSERWANLGYDQYRDIRFRRARTIWHGEHPNFELQLLPAAWLYKVPVSINVVNGGLARAIAPDNAWFTFGSVVGPPGDAPPIAFSGFRITGPINRPRVFDEIVVFQGASYFRAISQSQIYGLSARGLAIDTAQPSGEDSGSRRRQRSNPT